jgi:hypothetical protein
MVVAVPAGGLRVDLQAVRQRLEDPHHLVDGTDLVAGNDLSCLPEDAARDMLVVDIETELEHACLLRSVYLGTAAAGFHVRRLTEASFKVSAPTQIGPRWLRSDRPTLVGTNRLRSMRPLEDGYDETAVYDLERIQGGRPLRAGLNSRVTIYHRPATIPCPFSKQALAVVRPIPVHLPTA